MKKVYAKDNSYIDYIYTPKEFSGFIVGVLTKMDGKNYVVRVYGPVENLKQVVIRKELC